MQRVRQVLAGSWLGRLLHRTGLGKPVLARYERAVLRDGKHVLIARNQRFTFAIHDRMEITRVDMFVRSEGELMGRILGSIRPEDVVFDVGANIGMVSVVVAASTREMGVTVHAFEPNPETARRARRNADLNRCDNISVHNLALGRESGFAKLYTRSGGSRGTDSMIPSGESRARSLDVAVEQGDELVERLEVSPAVIKIDVEGAEMDVLLGLKRLIGEGGVRELFVEVHPRRLAAAGQDEAQLVRWLESRGLRLVSRKRRGEEFHPHFRREGS